MASPAGQFRPGRLIATFVVITGALYALMFLTPGSNTPKLGIDLQGGTRITLTAQTADGSTPTRESMAQARTILENRVNGSGVAGAQVQVEGSNQLVVTVPGNAADLGELTRSARLNIRPQFSTGYDLAALAAAVPSTSASETGTGSTTSSGPISRTAIGDTEVEQPTTTSGGAVIGPSSSVGETAGESAAETTATTAPSTTESGQGLRGAVEATTDPATTSSAPTTADTASSTPTTADTASSAPTTGDTASASGSTDPSASASGTGTSAAAATWPIAGSDPDNPNQPAGDDTTAWTAWQTAAQTALSSGGIACADIAPTAGIDNPDKPLLACGETPYVPGTDPCATSSNACVYLLDKTLIPGTEIDTAAATIDTQGTGGWGINLQFTSSGYQTWANYTANHNVSTDPNGTDGSFTAFTLDGQVLSSPQIQSAITTTVTRVSGTYTQQTATGLANALKFGALPLNFVQGESQSVSAQLGLEYLNAGLIAGGIGLLLVIIYCLVYYRLLGLITILSLVLSFGLVYVIMVLLGRWIGLSLDMAGVAGLIVAIGITADSFVIYFERLKDEVREGRSFRSAVPRGWERAKRTILSADAVSFLSALVLYVVAVGDVKGFAFTLGLSTVLDLVVVFLVTHPLVAWASGSKVFQSTRYSGLGAVAKAGAQQRASAARLATKEA
ncbi:protein translocase subunit SecD [Nakamurella sp. YIM 132087]|uniref:Protein translocase subunit SecD n=1 Tax=Nakamurella alba TaxID=2665158 RepID=A0A7K1FU50_9ACTN|nr:protein translocase subunit SecD [Nakamurella alba]MTD16364.1 protein translocase subunit SecD [Nakamurella alba]